MMGEFWYKFTTIEDKKLVGEIHTEYSPYTQKSNLLFEVENDWWKVSQRILLQKY